MNILITPSAEYVKYSLVLLKSLYVNHPNEIINLYVCGDVDGEEKTRLESFCYEHCSKGKVIFLKPSIEKIKGHLKTTSMRPAVVYYKLFCLGVIPPDVDRILYLDVDTIINGDISGLYNTEFKTGMCIAACGSTGVTGYDNYDEQKALKGLYFNTGVVLFNLAEFKRNISNDSYEILANKGNYNFDNGLLNIAFCKKTVYLPAELYNYRFNSYIGDELSDYKTAKIIHYSGWRTPYKPWDLYFEKQVYEMGSFQEGEFSISKKLNEMFSVWWKYAELLDENSVGKLKKELSCKTEWFMRCQRQYFKHTNELLILREEALAEVKKENENTIERYQAKLNVSKEWINAVLPEKIKCAVVGSCFSRTCMMRNPYFNEDYRDYVDLAYIFYHSSYLSLMSERIDYDTKGRKTQVESFQSAYDTWAETEFKKDLLEKLGEVNPEYLIVDNYADATCDVYETTDGKYFTLNYFLQSANVLDDFKDARVLAFDSEEKWSLLEKAIPAFYGRLAKVMPLDKVILVKGRHCEKRLVDGNIEYWHNAEIIRKRNEIWNRLDNLIIEHFPSIRVIDMTDTKYVSSDNFPIGVNNSAHYQSGYYRDLFLEYNKIFIEDWKKKG